MERLINGIDTSLQQIRQAREGGEVGEDGKNGGSRVLRIEQEGASVLVAPFYDATIDNLSDAEAIRKTSDKPSIAPDISRSDVHFENEQKSILIKWSFVVNRFV